MRVAICVYNSLADKKRHQCRLRKIVLTRNTESVFAYRTQFHNVEILVIIRRAQKTKIWYHSEVRKTLILLDLGPHFFFLLDTLQLEWPEDPITTVFIFAA